jgi:hypothetical protein
VYQVASVAPTRRCLCPFPCSSARALGELHTCPIAASASPPARRRPQKHDEPLLVAADILKKRDVVERVCRPIASRKAPPPPKAEPAPQPEPAPAAEPMEEEPAAGAAAEEPKPMEP